MIDKRYKSRGGFTIVELLVSMALIILIMAVLSEAFAAGLSAFRSLKGIGDMQERLRIVAGQLRRDLKVRHFDGDRKISDFGGYWVDPRLGQLPEKYRQVVVLFYLEAKSYEEVGAMLGLPLGTVKTFLYRGKQELLKIAARRPNAGIKSTRSST